MTVTVDLREVFAMIGGAVCIISPAFVALAIYANFGVYRKGEGGEKWNRGS